MQDNSDRRGPFQVLSQTLKYQNPWITVREDKVLRPDGSEGIFGVINMAGGGSVLPLTQDGYVYLGKEYKYGIEKESIETFSGGRRPGEKPIEAVKRELEEELGMTADTWEYLGYVDPFTTVASAPNHMFLASGLHNTKRKLDAGEDIEILRIKLKDALEMVLRGEITHSASCVMILRAAMMKSPAGS